MFSRSVRVSIGADILFAVGAIVALLVLAGWRFDIPALRHFGVGDYPTWPITAVANLMLSIALLSIDRIPEPLRRLLLMIPICIALIAFTEYATAVPLGLDNLLFPAKVARYALPYPGRPGFIPSISMLLMAWAGWRANMVEREGDTILFLLTCAIIGIAAMSFSMLLLLGKANWPISRHGSRPRFPSRSCS